jgi:hypothetical protein
MARASWYDPERERPLIEEQIHRLHGYLEALDDGVIEAGELDAQGRRVVAAMRAVEPRLDDELHADVTELLLELTAYNVMRLLRVLQQRREAAGG